MQVHESFDSDRDFGAGSQIIRFRSRHQRGFVNHLIQIRILVRVRESFDSNWDFGSRIMSHSIQIGTSLQNNHILYTHYIHI